MKVGTFLVGQAAVGERECYADALCGASICGNAICGVVWACHPPKAGLQLGGIPPTITFTVVDEVPTAGLQLGAIAPGLVIAPIVVPPPAGLSLGGTAPDAVRISSILSVPQAGLVLGATKPDSASAAWLTDLICQDIVLAEDTEQDLVLVGAASSDLDLDPEECL